MKKNVTTIAGVIVIIALIIWWWSSSAPQPVQITTPGTEGPTLQLVERLKAVQLDTSFFDDAQFLDLEAAPKTNIAGIQKGRSNPFRSGK